MQPLGLVLAFVAVLSGLVSCGDDDEGVQAADESSDSTTSTSDVSDGGPQLGDHWHLAVGFSRCGDEFPILQDATQDASGIHSHGDGLIHVHPFTTEAAGEKAVLGLFFDTAGAEVTDEGLETSEWSLPFDGECDGKPAKLMLATWSVHDAEGSMAIQTTIGSAEQLRSVPLNPDGSAIAIALATDDEQIPLPTSASQLGSPSDVAGASPLPPATGQGTRADVAFGLAPVLGVGEPPCEDSATPDAEEAQCYELGPVSLGADAIASAEAKDQDYGWIVFVTLTPAGDDSFDVAAKSCFEETPECPSGLLAIVLDGDVLSAPSIQEPEFDGELSISGDFTEAEAKELADALSP